MADVHNLREEDEEENEEDECQGKEEGEDNYDGGRG